MKINKETRQLSKELLRASFIDGQLDNGRIASLVMIVDRRRSRATTSRCWKPTNACCAWRWKSAAPRLKQRRSWRPESGAQIVANLKRKYGSDLTARFVVNRELLGGMRIRVGSDVWDSSVRNRLHRLQQQL